MKLGMYVLYWSADNFWEVEFWILAHAPHMAAQNVAHLSTVNKQRIFSQKKMLLDVGCGTHWTTGKGEFSRPVGRDDPSAWWWAVGETVALLVFFILTLWSSILKVLFWFFYYFCFHFFYLYQLLLCCEHIILMFFLWSIISFPVPSLLWLTSASLQLNAV